MQKHLRVDVADLHRASNGVLDHMDASRREHSGHDDDLVDAASRWNGEIADALQQVAASWADKRAELHKGIGRIGDAMSDGALLYARTDKDATDDIAKHTESF